MVYSRDGFLKVMFSIVYFRDGFLKVMFSIVYFRDGSLKFGDRILAVNEFSVVTLTLTEMAMLLSQCNSETSFTVEYDISVIGKSAVVFPTKG